MPNHNCCQILLMITVKMFPNMAPDARETKLSDFLTLTLLCNGDDVLTESARSDLLASPTVRMALSTSLWPGRELTHLFRAWDTALATYTQVIKNRIYYSDDQPYRAYWNIVFLSEALCLTWASLCWLSASPGLAIALLVSSISLADLSMTSPAQSSTALRVAGSSVVAATPLAAEAKDFRVWAISLADMPRCNRRAEKPESVLTWKVTLNSWWKRM